MDWMRSSKLKFIDLTGQVNQSVQHIKQPIKLGHPWPIWLARQGAAVIHETVINEVAVGSNPTHAGYISGRSFSSIIMLAAVAYIEMLLSTA